MIRISDITAYLRCPRIPYFLNKEENITNINTKYIENILLKELAFGYADYFKDTESFFEREIDRISKEVYVIYRKEFENIDKNMFETAVKNIKDYINEISLNLQENKEYYTSLKFETQPLLCSKNIGLSGTPDRLLITENGYAASIIKTGNIPENGVWKNDRLSLTAYTILIEENYNTISEIGYVEYAKYGKVIKVKIKRQDRRKIFQLLNRIKKIKKGFMPEKLEKAACDYCNFKSRCEDSKSTLASKFF